MSLLLNGMIRLAMGEEEQMVRVQHEKRFSVGVGVSGGRLGRQMKLNLSQLLVGWLMHH